MDKETKDWVDKEIKDGALKSPLAKNPDGSPKELRDLLNEAKKLNGP